MRDEDRLEIDGSSHLPDEIAKIKRCRRELLEGKLHQEPDALYTPMGTVRILLLSVISNGVIRKYRVGGNGSLDDATTTDLV